MINKETRYVTNDDKEFKTPEDAREHVLDLCREALDNLILTTEQGKASSRMQIINLIKQSIPDIKTAYTLYRTLHKILSGTDESEEE